MRGHAGVGAALRMQMRSSTLTHMRAGARRWRQAAGRAEVREHAGVA